ncbi:unnamed protein product [Caenorhabditis nigoni]
MCNHYNGKFRKRKEIYDIHGDICDFKFFSSESNYCSTHLPYLIRQEAVSDYVTSCRAEATLICQKEWVQFFGRCYKLTPKMMHFKEAENVCGVQGARIAFIHREILIRFWDEYFSNVDRVWADASEHFKSDLLHDKGDDLMIAFDGYPFNLPSRSILKVDGTKQKAFALCEYPPRITTAHLTHLGKMYSPIYYPTFSLDEGLFVRTTSQRRWEGNEKSDDEYCRRMMHAFVRAEGITVKSATPSERFLRRLGEFDREKHSSRPQDPWNTFYRTSIHYDHGVMERKRKNPVCQEDPNPLGKFSEYIDDELWGDDEPRMGCDSGTASTVIRMYEKGVEGVLETFSDARYAPIYCQVTVNH